MQFICYPVGKNHRGQTLSCDMQRLLICRYLWVGDVMSKSEHYRQDEIRLELSKYGLVFRTNAGSAWGGKYTNLPNIGNVVINPRRIELLPKGFSDLLFVGTDGRVAFIECKDDEGALRPEQEKFLKLMQSYGHRAGVARSVEDALEIIGVNNK